MKKNKLLIALISVFVLMAGLAAFLMTELYVPVASDKEAQTVRVEIPAGTSTKKIASLLSKNSLIRSEKLFYISARAPFILGRTTPYSLKSGVYFIKNSMTMAQILTLLESGQQEYVKTVFPEGLTISKLASMLDESGVCRKQHFIMACHDQRLLRQYNIPGESFEGLLFPDTYFFTPGMNPDDVVKMMVNNFLEKIKQIPQFEGKSIEEIYKTIILASIVEREYRVASEAPLIASVFTNRIEDNVGLYSCATIEFIITEILGRPHPDVITYDDLKIDSPYNTYKWAGLTPGPISNPGLVALKAAANPPVTDYYYFTLTDSEKGSHTFSRSFSSHTKAGTQFKTKKAAK